MESKRNEKRSLISLVALLFISLMVVPGMSNAATHRKINYQGYLTNAAGVPVNGTVQMVFMIYDVETGGTELWNEAHNVTLNHGVYNVVLGASSLLPNPITLPFDQQYYLGIKVGTDPEMTPRKPLSIDRIILYGTSDPTASVGNDGNLFIKVDQGGLAVTFFGPKTAGNWGTGIELKGQLPGAGPNLTPYKITVAKSACVGIDDGPLYTTESYYFAWWITNSGTAQSTYQAPMTVFLDGQVIDSNIVGLLPVNGTANCCICTAIGAGTSSPLSVGTHIIAVSVDSGKNDGTTNTLQKSITVQ